MRAFITSTGRCGSLSLARWLSTFTPTNMEPCTEIGATLFASRFRNGEGSVYRAVEVLLGLGRWKRTTVIYDHSELKLQGCHSTDKLYQKYTKITNLDRDEEAIWVDHVISTCVDMIELFAPEAKYVWMIRSGWDCVASFMGWKWFRDSDDISEFDVYANNRICAPWVGEMPQDAWDKLSNLAKCCWYWSWMNRWIEKQLRAVPAERKLFLRLEDWSDDTARELCGFLGVAPPADLELPKSHASQWPELRPEWTEDERRMFEYFCGDSQRRWYAEQEYRSPR